MGLLDDAIREHLDLKRRRGADPAEIERAEREALGPVRREPPFAADEVLTGTSSGQTSESPALDEAEDETPPRPRRRGLHLRRPGSQRDRAPAEEARHGLHAEDDERRSASDGRTFAAHDDFEDGFEYEYEYEYEDDEEAAESPRLPEREPEVGLGRTVEYDVEGAMAPEDAMAPEGPGLERERSAGEPGAGEEEPAEDEDPLQETPEFLEETPEHDRLWFEQKPPRDFDFDG